MGLPANELQKYVIRKKIAMLWMEVDRYQSNRYSLRPVSQMSIAFDSSAVYNELRSVVANFRFGENPETKCMCFFCYVMGYYSFFQQDWENTRFFFNLSHYQEFHWGESTTNLILNGLVLFLH